jgi:hypothetical protein
VVPVVIAILATIFKFFDPIARITDKIVDLQIKKADAKTEQERIAADERVKALESRRDVMVAESGLAVNAYMRTAIAIGPAIYLLKIFIWDKVLKLGTTDALDSNLWQVVIAVIGFYFLYDIAARWKR